MGYDPQKVIDIALAEVGYLEKASNDQLDDKTANAGRANYTKYARDLATYPFYNGKKYGVAWCDVFYDWCMVEAYGKDVALELTCQPKNPSSNCGAGCKFSRDYYKNNGQLFDKPEPGDQIFFYSKDKKSISHTGLVYKVDERKVYTVEGNTSGSSGIVPNGGGVFKKSYLLTNSRIAGYGRPLWNLLFVTESATKPTAAYKYTQKTFIKAVQKACGAKVDGIAGPETISKTVTVSAGYNRKHPVVLPIQKRLKALGYETVGKLDGIAGPRFTEAVKQFQADNDCVVDGKIHCRNKTWRKLLGMD